MFYKKKKSLDIYKSLHSWCKSSWNNIPFVFICLFVFLFFYFFPLNNRIQHELEVTTKQAIFVDSSISDTIRTCIVLGNHRAAMKVKTEFKVCKITHMPPSQWEGEWEGRVPWEGGKGSTYWNRIHWATEDVPNVIFCDCLLTLICFITFSCNFIFISVFWFSLRFLRRDGIGLKFLLWLQSEIGMLWKSFQRRRGHQLVMFLLSQKSRWNINYVKCVFFNCKWFLLPTSV